MVRDPLEIPQAIWGFIAPKQSSEKDIFPLAKRMSTLTRILYRWGSDVNTLEAYMLTLFEVTKIQMVFFPKLVDVDVAEL